MSPVTNLHADISHNLQGLIDKQIELDARRQIKQKRKKMIIDKSISKQKNLVARKYLNMSHENEVRMRLH